MVFFSILDLKLGSRLNSIVMVNDRQVFLVTVLWGGKHQCQFLTSCAGLPISAAHVITSQSDSTRSCIRPQWFSNNAYH
jgi:hypothetical protein